MIQKTKVLNYTIYDNPSELSDQIKTLIEAAKNACNLSHAPYSKFHVGAASLLINDVIVQGANQENAAYPMCTCAEQIAIYNGAINYPNIPPKALAIHVNVVPNNDHPPSPCGACRQVILETEAKYACDINIYISSDSETIFKFESIKDLLPFYFSGKDLA